MKPPTRWQMTVERIWELHSHWASPEPQFCLYVSLSIPICNNNNNNFRIGCWPLKGRFVRPQFNRKVNLIMTRLRDCSHCQICDNCNFHQIKANVFSAQIKFDLLLLCQFVNLLSCIFYPGFECARLKWMGPTQRVVSIHTNNVNGFRSRVSIF